MANTKISALPANTNPTGSEELVYALNNANGKMTLNTMKTFSNSWQQAALVSGVNIKTINGDSILWSGNLVIQWWGGGWAGAAYDAVVDASGGGDYTNVSAAIAAGKYNIFVKNWSYTETAWWDPYSNSKSKLRIVWESESGVQITFPSTATTAHGYLIDMRYGNAADFYMENVSFNITLTSSNAIFYRDNWWTNFIVKNCTFTYTTNVATPTATQHTLFYTKVVSSASDAVEWWRVYSGLYGCSLNTETTKIINIAYDILVADMCKFSSSAWRIQLVHTNNNSKLYNCYVDAYELGWLYAVEFYNSYINITTWNVYDGNWYNITINRIDNSKLKIWTLQNTPTIYLWLCTNSDINCWTYDIGWTIVFNGIESIKSNCKIKCGELYVGRHTEDCVVDATSLKLGQWYTRINWCRFYSWLTAVTFSTNDCIITWNVFEWTWTMSITGNDIILTSNWLKWMSLTDTWTWTQKANNVTA